MTKIELLVPLICMASVLQAALISLLRHCVETWKAPAKVYMASVLQAALISLLRHCVETWKAPAKVYIAYRRLTAEAAPRHRLSATWGS